MTDKSKLGCSTHTKNDCTQSCILFAAFLLAAALDAGGLSRKLAVAEHFSATKISGFHYATQLFAEVGRNRVTVMQSVFAHCEFAFGIKNDEVGVVARGEATFAFVAAGETCGSFGHPTR